jgi:hypothetical protein
MTADEKLKIDKSYSACGKTFLARKFIPTQTDFGPTKDDDGFISNTPTAPVDVDNTYTVISVGEEIVNCKVGTKSIILLTPAAMGGIIVDTVDVEGGKCQIVNIQLPDVLAIVN